MTDTGTTPAARNQRPAAADCHEVVRYTKGDATRIYGLRIVSGAVELWRITELPEGPPTSIKECDFTGSEQVLPFLEEIRRSLTAGGWKLD